MKNTNRKILHCVILCIPLVGPKCPLLLFTSFLWTFLLGIR